MQPTIVDAEAFLLWKNEALEVFTNTWAAIYKPSKNEKGEDLLGDPASVQFLEECKHSLFVVNIVENDYVGGDLNKVLVDFINENQAALTAL